MDLLELFVIGGHFVGITIGYIIFFYFIQKIYNNKDRFRQIIPFLGISLIFLVLSIGYFFRMLYLFYLWEYAIVNFPLILIFYAFLTINLIIYYFIFEYIMRKTKFILTGYLIISLIIILCSQNIQQAELNIFVLISIAIPFGMGLFYFNFIKPTSGYLRKRMIIAFIGSISFAIGSNTRLYYIFISMLLGVDYRPAYYITLIIGGMVIVFSELSIAYGFSAFNSLTDLNWKDKLKELIIVTEAGICLYAYSFDNNEALDDPELIAGGFSGINLLLTELIRAEGKLHSIDYKDVKILLEQENEVLFVLLLKDESVFLQYKLKKFVENFVFFFKETLVNWDGNLKYFTPTRELIRKHFETE